MISNAEAINRLKWCSCSKYMRVAIDMGIDALEHETQWVRVNDRLPDKIGAYLTAYSDGFVCENEWHYIGETEVGWVKDADAVRYWMPLPVPPKGIREE